VATDNQNVKYSVIYADPPWEFPDSGGTKNSRGLAKKFYPTMKTEDICSIPVKEWVEDNSMLFIWASFRRLQEVFKVIEAWGFEYYGIGFLWAKTNKSSGFHFGMGYYTRHNTEPCFIAIRGKPKPLNRDVRELIVSQVEEHSKKPDEIRDRISRIYDGRKLEMFARKKVDGWDAWGNEIESQITLKEIGL